jgi:ElaB/YqjD/DUF883 family membrane-anchored ribosome-binding protein
MFNSKISDRSSILADEAAASAEKAIKSTRRAANSTLDSLSDTVQGLHGDATPVLDRAAARASAVLHQSADALQESSAKLREQARRATDHTIDYIKDQPVKSIAIAVAAGALLTVFAGLARRSSQRH